MSVVVKAFPEYPSFKELVLLGDAYFTLEFSWRATISAWYCSVSTEAGVPVVTGVRLEPGQDILLLADPAIAPDGALLVVDAGGCGQKATRSVVGLQFDGAGAATIPAGSTVTDGTNYWYVTSTVSKAGGGAAAVGVASPQETGPVAAAAGTLGTLAPAVAGITATNPGDAALGLEHIPILQADLGVNALVVFLPATEYPAATAADEPTITVTP